jgi:hypothetical protein
MTDSSCKEEDSDYLAEERRLGRESEAGGDKPRSWASIRTRASIPRYEALGHTRSPRPLPVRPRPPRLSRAHIGAGTPILAAEVKSKPTTRHSSLENPLDPWQNDRKSTQMLRTADEVSPVNRCVLGWRGRREQRASSRRRGGCSMR